MLCSRKIVLCSRKIEPYGQRSSDGLRRLRHGRRSNAVGRSGSAQSFGSIRRWLIPPGSLRERVILAGLRTPRRNLGVGTSVPPSDRRSLSVPPSSPFHAGIVGPASDWRVAATVPPVTDLGAEECRSLLAGAELDLNAAGDDRPQDNGSELVYAPLNWQIDETSLSHSRFINLVILSPVHRSGSTLLQRICNSRKGTLIWGEHGGLLAHYANIYASAAYFSLGGAKNEPTTSAGEKTRTFGLPTCAPAWTTSAGQWSRPPGRSWRRSTGNIESTTTFSASKKFTMAARSWSCSAHAAPRQRSFS